MPEARNGDTRELEATVRPGPMRLPGPFAVMPAQSPNQRALRSAPKRSLSSRNATLGSW